MNLARKLILNTFFFSLCDNFIYKRHYQYQCIMRKAAKLLVGFRPNGWTKFYNSELEQMDLGSTHLITAVVKLKPCSYFL